MKTVRLTVGQALIRFLKQQYVERDGTEYPFFAGCLGIFGHGIVAGVGEGLQENPDFRYYQVRNEQAAVHIAAGFAKMSNRLRTMACISSIGPGATNMVTGAAGATINRLPVLILPGDTFARRNVAPVLQQLESGSSQDISVNDAFKPVSRYWDRINRADQLIMSLPEAMRVLTSPADTGAVTLALPQDVQAESFAFPVEFLERRAWHIARQRPDRSLVQLAATLIGKSRRPLIIAGGGVQYSDAAPDLRMFAEQTGIPVAETQAGKGALPYDHPLLVGAIGVTGTRGANLLAREADIVIGIGTRYSDFTTASKTAFRNPEVCFININAAECDAFKHAAVPLQGDAKVTIQELQSALGGFCVAPSYRSRAMHYNAAWDREVTRIYQPKPRRLMTQGEVIGIVNEVSSPTAVVVGAAGSLPGDLHKLWRTRDTKGYHLEYGYSCMGYEIAGGLGVKMAAPDRDVYVMLGDGSYLMMAQEILTSVQEGYKLIIILLDNHGFSSIGGLSESIGSGGFGTAYRFRQSATGLLDGKVLPIDFVENARSLGAHAIRCDDPRSLREGLNEAARQPRTTVLVAETDINARVPGYESWWDVAISEVSRLRPVRNAFAAYKKRKAGERYFFPQ
jgi:3D-(3,5/4)-trihydroxycyclohexane-1,2-dione acylhydrolase (decyclizing)